MKVAVEAVPTIEIDVLPSERRHALQPVDRALVALDFQRAEQFRQDDAVVVHHGVGDETGALIPQLLLML